MRGSEKPTETLVVFLYKGKRIKRVSKAKASQTSSNQSGHFSSQPFFFVVDKTTATFQNPTHLNPWKVKDTNLKSAMTLHHFTSSSLLVKSTFEMQLFKINNRVLFPTV